MGFFKKEKDLIDYDGHNNNLFSDDDDFELDMGKKSFFGNRKNTAAPHAITVDELNAPQAPETIEMSSGHQPSKSVYEELKAKQNNEDVSFDDDYVPSWATAKKDEQSQNADSFALTSLFEKHEPIKDNQNIVEPADNTADDFLEKCKIAVDLATTGVHYDDKDFEAFASESYYKPIDAKAAAEEVDVEDIIRRLKDENNLPPIVPKATEELPTNAAEAILNPIVSSSPSEDSENKYEEDLNVVDSEQTVNVAEPSVVTAGAEQAIIAEEADNETAAPSNSISPVEEIPMSVNTMTLKDSALASMQNDAIKLVDEAPKEETPEQGTPLNVEVIPMDSESDIMHTDMSLNSATDTLPHDVTQRISINATEEVGTALGEAATAANLAAVATATDKTVVFSQFENLDLAISQKADLDVANDYSDYDDFDEEDVIAQPYYETNDPDLENVDDYKDLNDAARLRTKLMGEIATGFAFTMLSFVATLLIAIFSLPFANSLGGFTVGIINLLLLLATMFFNISIFNDFKNLSKLKMGFDSCVAVASIVVLLQTVFSVFMYDQKFATIAGAATFLMAVNSLVKNLRSRRILKGLEIIANSEKKRAVTAAGGVPAATISSGAVDGDSIVLSGREVTNVKNYLKQCSYKSPFDLNVKYLFFASIALAAVIGLVVGVFTDFITGITVAALAMCAACPVCAIFTAEMPMYFSVTGLAKYNAMLAGFKGAYNLNLSNVIAIKTSDLFPDGSITLYDMKPLGQNEIGHSLMDAAAIAIAANSPIAPIFKNIIGAAVEDELPEVTGFQYEDKMGITGWIKEKTILIGNRNLMQGHNISVPPATVDQKILKAGYFPVYIAVDGVPCLLFIVKYEADETIKKELQRVCDTGMTIVVYPEDPNATDMMLCDYFGLPNDAVKVMRHNGRVAYEKATAPTDSTSAPACYGKSICGLFAAVSSAINMKNTISTLTVLYIIAAVLGVVTLLYFTVIGKLWFVSSLVFIAFQAFFALLSIIFAGMVKK